MGPKTLTPVVSASMSGSNGLVIALEISCGGTEGADLG